MLLNMSYKCSRWDLFSRAMGITEEKSSPWDCRSLRIPALFGGITF